jgi:hypothetical protein
VALLRFVNVFLTVMMMIVIKAVQILRMWNQLKFSNQYTFLWAHSLGWENTFNWPASQDSLELFLLSHKNVESEFFQWPGSLLSPFIFYHVFYSIWSFL